MPARSPSSPQLWATTELKQETNNESVSSCCEQIFLISSPVSVGGSYGETFACWFACVAFLFVLFALGCLGPWTPSRICFPNVFSPLSSTRSHSRFFEVSIFIWILIMHRAICNTHTHTYSAAQSVSFFFFSLSLTWFCRIVGNLLCLRCWRPPFWKDHSVLWLVVLFPLRGDKRISNKWFKIWCATLQKAELPPTAWWKPLRWPLGGWKWENIYLLRCLFSFRLPVNKDLRSTSEKRLIGGKNGKSRECDGFSLDTRLNSLGQRDVMFSWELAESFFCVGNSPGSREAATPPAWAAENVLAILNFISPN